MAYEQCPKCGTKKHQLNKCPNCWFSRTQYELAYEKCLKCGKRKKKNDKCLNCESSVNRQQSKKGRSSPGAVAGMPNIRKKHGKEAMRKKAEALELTRNILVYGEPKKDKATHEAYQFKIQSSDYGWNSKKSICPVCGGDGGANGQCYKCEGSGWA